VGGWVTVLFLIIWIAASGVLLYLYSQQNSQNEDIFCKNGKTFSGTERECSNA